jgi:hypothetical protein
MDLSSEMKARVLASARGERSPTRPQVRRKSMLLAVAAVMAGMAVFLAAGGARPGGRPLLLMLATSAGTALIAGVAVWAGVGRGRSMLGRQRALLLAVGLLGPLALLIWRSGVSSLWEGMSQAWPGRPGFRCLGLSLGVGIVPLFLALYARRRSDPVSPATAGAAVGVGTGLGAAFLVDLWCPVAHASHVLLGHVLPVALLAIVGAALGARWLAISERRSPPPPRAPDKPAAP